jgi:hypothetical protein
MDQTAADTVTKAFLANIHRKLQEAASIAKAAEVCAETGNVQTAVKMVGYRGFHPSGQPHAERRASHPR